MNGSYSALHPSQPFHYFPVLRAVIRIREFVRGVVARSEVEQNGAAFEYAFLLAFASGDWGVVEDGRNTTISTKNCQLMCRKRPGQDEV